jgi:hypothetical protein
MKLQILATMVALSAVKADPVTCNNLKTMYQDSICCDNPTEEINCTHTLSINSDSTELSLEGGVLTLDLGTTIAAVAANTAAVAANTAAVAGGLAAAVAATTAALNGGFEKINSDTCKFHDYDGITSFAECHQAAVALLPGWSDVSAGTNVYWPQYPHGCLFIDGDMLYNDHDGGDSKCEVLIECACQTPSLIAAVAYNSAAARSTLGGFESVNNQTCAFHDYGGITSLAECERAAAELGLKEMTAETVSSLYSYSPGCSYDESGYLSYNTVINSEIFCDEEYPCLCKTPGLLGAAIAAIAANTAAVNGGFEEVRSRTCVLAGTEAITTMAECETAAEALKMDTWPYGIGSWSYMPPGCINGWGDLYLNTESTSIDCSVDQACACKKPGLVGAVADNSAAITANTAANTANTAKVGISTTEKNAITDNSVAITANTVALNGGVYEEVTSGTCADAGSGVITSEAECNQAAAALGWGDTTADTWPTYGGNVPPGCFYYLGTRLYWGNKKSNVDCSSNNRCACQDWGQYAPSLVAAITDNSAAITANSAAVAANTAALNGGFVSLTTGTCVTAGKQAITSADECETAGVALGLIWPGDVIIEDMGNEYPGCFVNYFGVVFNLSGDPTLVCDSKEMEMDMCLCKTPSLANIIARLAALEV